MATEMALRRAGLYGLEPGRLLPSRAERSRRGKAKQCFRLTMPDGTSAELMEVSTTKPPTSALTHGGIVKEVQSAVNSARRLEQRLHKLKKEVLQKGQAWDSWVFEMRSAYAKQHERHRAEQRRLAAEIQDLENQTQAAYLQVQQAALHQQLPKQDAAPPPPLEWEMDMDVDADLTEEQTRQELARMLGRGPSEGTTTAPATPPPNNGTMPRTPTRPAPLGSGLSPAATVDAYREPPSMETGTTGSEAPGGLLDPRGPPQQREPTSGQSTLAGKLSDKRRAYRSAMGPFGLAPRPDNPPAAKVSDAGPAPGLRLDTGQGRLIDDDNEELRSASPGFGNME